MTKIDQLMRSYAEYHLDPRNKATHFIGVPLIIYAILIPLGWFRFSHPELVPFPLTAATVFVVAMSLYYFRLDRVLAAIQIPIVLILLYASDLAAQAPLTTSALTFAGAFVGGWIIQLIGHYFEGRRPALVDNLLQVLNAPLFLAMEVAFACGWRRELRLAVQQSGA